MDLTIAVESDDVHRCPRLLIASDQCRAGSDLARVEGLAERRPAEAVVVLRVQVGDDVDHRVHDTIVDGTSIQSGRARSASDGALTPRSVSTPPIAANAESKRNGHVRVASFGERMAQTTAIEGPNRTLPPWAPVSARSGSDN